MKLGLARYILYRERREIGKAMDFIGIIVVHCVDWVLELNPKRSRRGGNIRQDTGKEETPDTISADSIDYLCYNPALFPYGKLSRHELLCVLSTCVVARVKHSRLLSSACNWISSGEHSYISRQLWFANTTQTLTNLYSSLFEISK